MKTSPTDFANLGIGHLNPFKKMNSGSVNFSNLVVYQAINEDMTNQLVGFNAHLLVLKKDFPLRIQLRRMIQ